MSHWLLPRSRGRASGTRWFFSLGALLLFASALIPRVALANECPNMAIQDTSGGTTTFAVPACSPFGTNFPAFAVQPSHGTVSVSSNDADITYVNNGDGATSDSFAWYDDEGEPITTTVTITASAPTPITLTPTTAPNGHIGTAYSLQFHAAGGNGGPYTYVINAGTLPAGISDNAAGLISGTPTESGTFNFTETATDTSGHVGTENITLTIVGAISIAPTTLPMATAYVAYNQTLSASGGTAPYTFSRASGSNALPPGLALSANGTLSGTPTTLGTTVLTIVVNDAAGGSNQQTFSFVVASPTITLAPTTLGTTDQGAVYNNTITASGGTAPYTYTVASGALPPGMNLGSSGNVTGTPTSSGTFTVGVTAADAHGFTGTVNETLTVSPPLTLSPTTLAAATVGAAYSATLTAGGGVAPYTYSVSAGVLPSGLGLNAATGAITGTPTASGNFSVSFTVTDSNGVKKTNAEAITVNAVTLVLAPPSLPTGTQGTAYSQQITASGGVPPYTFAIISGALPAGLTLSSAGLISGTPSASGNFSFQVKATDSAGGGSPDVGTQVFALQINTGAPTISTATLPAATVGATYSQVIAATGGSAPYAFAVTSGTLPLGMTLSSAGVLSGTPTAGGAFPITITVTDSTSQTGSKNYPLTVNSPTVTITPVTLPSPTDGVAYSQSLSASGGTAPYSFAITAGALPAGLALAANGTLSGTPTAGGNFNFTVTATDASTGTGPYTGSRAYSLVTNRPTLTLAPGSGTLNATGGVAFSQAFTASGAVAPYNYSETGALPTGLTWNPATGTIAGTPTQTGSFPISVTATDHSTGAGPYSVTGNYTLVIAPPVISIAPATLPAPVIGTAYSQTVTASGGVAPYTYTISSGTLPTGLSFNSTSGTIVGTPTAAGTFTVTLQASDADNFTATRTYTVTVAAPSLVLTPAVLPNANAEVPFSQTLATSGGTAPYSYAVSAGALPPGLTLSGAVLSGTPTAAGTFNFTVRSTDSSTGTGAPFATARAYTFTVNAPSITLQPATLPAPVDGSPYTQSVTATGGTAPYSYAVSAGVLPNGLTLNAATGQISGTPSATGSFNFTIQATDAGRFTGSQAYTATIGAPALVLTPATLPAATAEAAYSQTFSTTGGNAPYTYAIASGALPAGVTLNTSTGTLSGTPTAAGTFTFSVRSTDSSTGVGAPFNVTHAYTFTVNAPAISLQPTTLPASADASPYSQLVTASGGKAPYSYSISSGTLPTGLTLNPATGQLSGTPTAAGTFNFTIEATDANSFTGSQAYALNINSPTLALTPATLPAATGEAAYSQTFSTTGGNAPYTYAIASGALPAGLTLNTSTGTLSGTPTAAGTFNFSVRSADSSTGAGAPFNVTHAYTFTVNAPAISLQPTTLPASADGSPYSQLVTASGGKAPYSYSISSGTLPAGLTLNLATGQLSGTPTAAGTFNFTIEATDANSFTGSQAYALNINSPTLALTPATLPAATGEAAYSQTFSTTGGNAPYTYAISTGALPAGLTLNTSTGTLSGTPTAAGTFNFSVRSADSSTGVGAPFVTTHPYTLTVNAPGVVISPTTVPAAQVAVAYSQTLSASGGNGTYAFTVTSGALPGGLTLATNGVLKGVPTTGGSFNVTVTATDGLGFTGTQAYAITVQQAAPVAVNDTASTTANQAVTVAVTANDTGPITAIAVGTGPSHGTATVHGLNVVYTPAQNFFGTDTFTYTATGPGGTSSPATVTVSVNSLAVPTVTPLSATVLAGTAVTLHATTGASGGPFTTIAVAKAPTSGTATVSGTDIIYTADAAASGQMTFTYTVSNAFGTSLPGTATITIDARPVAAPHSATEVAGAPVQVNLTQGATGGPFTAASVVSVSPANAGSGHIVASGGGYSLSFNSTPTFSGTVTVAYTLTNAYATSAPGIVTISVTARPDPSKDAEVLGLLGAQADATRRFAQGQIDNFQQRLEILHDGGGQGFQNNLSFASASQNNFAGLSTQGMGGGGMDGFMGTTSPNDPNRRNLAQSQSPGADPASSTLLPNGFAVWTGGAINFGSRGATSAASGFDFNTGGVSVGMDKRLSADFAAGVGFGYGHDNSDVGRNGTNSTSYSYSLAAYASFNPSPSTFIDGLAGYEWLSFDSRRFVTADGSMVNGQRDGTQWFASLSGGYEYHNNALLISPYGRLDLANANLDSFTEHGNSIYALSYMGQTVKTTTTSIGVHADYVFKEDFGTFAPQMRLEYEHDFQGSSNATMTYADLIAGPIYRAPVDPLAHNHYLIGIGANWQFNNNLIIRLEYDNQLDTGDQDNQSILFNIQKKF